MDKNIRARLKQCQPYFIEKDLLPQIYFIPDENNTEYWIFKYAFITRLSDLAIGIRLGYTRQSILQKTKKILNANQSIIENFLQIHSK